jgi:hypothetical protein
MVGVGRCGICRGRRSRGSDVIRPIRRVVQRARRRRGATAAPTPSTRSRCSTLARRPAPDSRGRNGCPLAALCALDRVADVVAVGVTRCGDCVVMVWCPACGKRHVHGWPWDSVEPGARRPHCRFLSPHDYYIPRPARKLLAHLDAGPRSPATTDAAQEPVPPGEGDAPPVAARAPSAGRARKPPAPIPFVRASMREFSRLMNLQGVQQHVSDNHRRRVDAGENAQNPIDSNARSRLGSSS